MKISANKSDLEALSSFGKLAEQRAQQKSIAKKTGYAPDAIDINFANEIVRDSIIAKNPHIQKALRENPDAVLYKDYAKQMDEVSGFWDIAQDTGRAVARGLNSFAENLITQVATSSVGGGTTPYGIAISSGADYNTQLQSKREIEAESIARQEAFKREFDYSDAYKLSAAQRAKESKENDTLWGNIKAFAANPRASSIDLVESASSVAPSLAIGAGAGQAVSAATRIPQFIGRGLGVASATANTEYDSTVRQKIVERLNAEGREVNVKNILAVQSDSAFMTKVKEAALKRAAVIGGVEGITGGLAGRILPNSNKALRITAEGTAQSVAGGAGEALAQLATDGKVTDLQSVAAELVGGSVMSLPEYVGLRNKDVQFAKQVQNSELAQKDVDFAAEFASQVASASDKYIASYSLNQETKAQLAAVFPHLAEDIAIDAIVKIDGAEYTQATIKHPELTDVLPNIVRDDVDGFSVQEMQEIEQNGLAQIQDVSAINEAYLSSISQRVVEGLEGSSFDAQTKAAYGNLVSSFYDATSSRLGITPEDLYNAIGLKVNTAQVDTGFEGFAQTQEFLDWDAGNAVRDSDGQLIEVFHGTDAQFIEFKNDPNRKVKDGFFFTSDKAVAQTYSNSDNTLSGYVRMSNPYVVDAQGKGWASLGATTDQIVSEAKAAGHDGVVFKNIHDVGAKASIENIDALSNDGKSDVFVVFDSNQFKVKENTRPTESPNIFNQDSGNVLSEINGFFNPENTSITITPQADFSTFIHESGHFFLDSYEKLSALDESIKSDLQTVLDWAGWEGGVESLIEASADAKRDVHERFARGYEAYVREGKSPNKQLRGFFERFGEFLRLLYRSLTQLDVQLSDDVRKVMGRMIAVEDVVYSTLPDGKSNASVIDNTVQALLSDDSLKTKYNAERNAYARKAQKELAAQPVYQLQVALESGLDLADVYHELGYESEAHAREELRNAPSLEDAVEMLTDQYFVGKYGEIPTAETLRERVLREVYSDKTLEEIAKEIGGLNYRIAYQYAKQKAQERSRAMRVVDLNPRRFATAERQLLRREVNNPDARLPRLMNAAMVQAQAKYKARAEKQARILRRLAKQQSKTVDPEFKDQIQAILSYYDMAAHPKKEVRPFAEFAESLAEEGLEINTDVSLLRPQPFQSLTVAELEALYDTVMQIEKAGRNKYKTVRRGKINNILQIQDAINANVRANWTSKNKAKHTPTSSWGKAKVNLNKYFVGHLKIRNIFERMDGGKGELFDYIITPLHDATVRENVLKEQTTKQLLDILKPVLDNDGSTIVIKGRELDAEQRFAAILNMGNEGNLQRLRDGYGWTGADIAEIARSATETELLAAQKVWDLYEQFRPEVARIERTLTGSEPDWIEAKPLNVLSKDGKQVQLRGGYYPAKYDTRADVKSAAQADNTNILSELKGKSTVASLRKTFTKQRSEKVSRPILLSLSATTESLTETIHSISYSEALADVKRIISMKNPNGKNVIETINEVAGAEYSQAIRTWLDHITAGIDGTPTDSVLSKFRRNASVSLLGYNLVSAIGQVSGIINITANEGVIPTLGSMAKFMANPVGAMRKVRQKSAFMSNRSKTFNRDLNELNSIVTINNGKGLTKRAARLYKAFQQRSYLPMVWMQSIADTINWDAAYNNALNAGETEARAIALADASVIKTQGDGSIMNLSGFERGGEAAKIFTGLMSYMATVYNNLYSISHDKRIGILQKIVKSFTLIYVAGMAEKLIKEGLTESEDDDKPLEEKLAKLSVQVPVENVLGMFVGVRELSSIASSLATGDTIYGYKGATATKVFGDASTALAQIPKVAEGEGNAASARAFISLLGSITGLPSTQINKAIKGYEALESGQADSPTAVLTGYKGKIND